MGYELLGKGLQYYWRKDEENIIKARKTRSTVLNEWLSKCLDS